MKTEMGPAGSKHWFLFGFSGVENADVLLRAVTVFAGAHHCAFITTFTLEKSCASVPNSQKKHQTLSGVAAR